MPQQSNRFVYIGAGLAPALQWINNATIGGECSIMQAMPILCRQCPHWVGASPTPTTTTNGYGEEQDKTMGRHRKSAIGEIITGTIMISIPFLFFGGFPSMGMGMGMGMHMGFPFWILIAIGAGSLIRGITRLAAKSKKLIDSKPNAKQRKLELENKVLKAAQKAGGKVTVAKTALYIDAPIEETETILNSLASRGHASVEVSSEGQVLYMFPDFLDRDLLDS